MPRLAIVEPKDATGEAARVLSAAPINIFKGLAVHPPILGAFVAFSSALDQGGALTKLERGLIQLRVSELRRCVYCVTAQTKVAAGAGLDEHGALDARRGRATDPKHRALLAFAEAVLTKNGVVSDAQLQAFRAAGYSDQAVIEVIASITLMTFTNLYNQVHDTVVDFPPVPVA